MLETLEGKKTAYGLCQIGGSKIYHGKEDQHEDGETFELEFQDKQFGA